MSSRIHREDKVVFLLLVGCFIFLLVAPFILSGPTFQGTFAEDGLVETLSVYGWIAGAVLILIFVRPLGFRAVSFAILSLALGAREADWHVKFTTEGVMKISFYTNSSIPLLERLIAGLIVLILAAGMVYAFFVAIRFFLSGGWKARSGVWLFLTGACLVGGKLLDGLPRELDNLFGIVLSEGWILHLQALEEGIETMAPIAFVWSIWLTRTGKSYFRA